MEVGGELEGVTSYLSPQIFPPVRPLTDSHLEADGKTAHGHLSWSFGNEQSGGFVSGEWRELDSILQER